MIAKKVIISVFVMFISLLGSFAAESGDIVSASPSTFFPGASQTVTVRVHNTGDTDDMLVLCDSKPSGWTVTYTGSDKNAFGDCNPRMTSGSYYNASFTVTAPSSGSGTIVWKFYDDDFSNNLLDTLYQSVGVSNEGDLGVSISPSGARSAGAQWKLTTGSNTSWHDSGSVITVAAGTYTIQYKTVSGWVKPSNESVTVFAQASVSESGTYVEDEGDLGVSISPSGARSDGAQWRLTSGSDTSWHDSGDVITISSGSYTIQYRTISGWIKPSNESVTVSAQASTSESGTYVENVGDLGVTINPSSARSGGAQWRLTSGSDTSWHNSGVTITVPAGTYTINYRTLSDWTKPPDESVTVVAQASVSGGPGEYYQNIGDLGVTIEPSGVRSVGAQWKLTSGPDIGWHNSGDIISIPPGSYTIQYKAVSGWIAPADGSVAVIFQASVSGGPGVYYPDVGDVGVTIEPSAARSGGAQWKLTTGSDTSWHDSGDVISVSPGDYTIQYKTIPGWVVPSNESVSVISQTSVAGGPGYYSKPLFLSTIYPPDITDKNHLPYLDSGRADDLDGDGVEDAGWSINSSRCFAPGDTIVVHATVENRELVEREIRLITYYNDDTSTHGLPIGTNTTIMPAAFLTPEAVLIPANRRLAVEMNAPSIGEYYFFVVIEEYNGSQWIETDAAWVDNDWIDGGSAPQPVQVNNNKPVILLHGWGDDGTETFANLEMLIEINLNRPVRYFEYDTGKVGQLGDLDGSYPRVDEGNDGKPSLSDQLHVFLENCKGVNSSYSSIDAVCHSMGGLVVRNYCLEQQKIDRLVIIGTPNYGGNFAAAWQLEALFSNQAKDLEFGCALSWKLFDGWTTQSAQMPEVLAIVGTDNLEFGNYNDSDQAVLCSSASLENLGGHTYYVPGSHVDFSNFALIVPALLGLNNPIAGVDDFQHDSWEPIKQFLSGAEYPFAGLPGNAGGSDDVGDSDFHHLLLPEYLREGSINIVAKDGDTVLDIDVLGHLASPLLIPAQVAIRKEGGVLWDDFSPQVNNEGEGAIAYIMELDGNDAIDGTERYADYEVYLNLPGYPEDIERSVRVKAGETTVVVVDYAGIPDTPSSVYPGDGDELMSLTPTFEWSAFSSSTPGRTQTGYQLRVRDDLNEDPPVYDEFIANNSANTHALPEGILEYGKDYHWHVRYQDSGGQWSAWSADTPETHQNFTTVTLVTNTIYSAYGSPNPSVGDYAYLPDGTVPSGDVNSPVNGSDGIRYLCTGHTGTGNAPTDSGTSYNSFVINQDSTLTWNWDTQYRVISSSGPDGEITPNATEWFDTGESVSFSAVPDPDYEVAYWRVNGSDILSSSTSYSLPGVYEPTTVEVFFSLISVPTRIIRLEGDLAFDDVLVGSSTQRSLTIHNDGNDTLTVSGINYPSGFSGNWSGDVPLESSVVVPVTFSPVAEVSYGTSLHVDANETIGTDTHPCSGTGRVSPILSCSPSSLEPNCIEGQDAINQSFEVWNSGNGSINYSISDNVGWLEVIPSSGTSSGGQNSHQVIYTTSELSAGTYSAQIIITATDESISTKYIDISLTVSDIFMVTDFEPLPTGELVIRWIPVDGRYYSVYWKEDLQSEAGWIPVEVNLRSGIFTDTVHSAESQGFYKLEVSTEPITSAAKELKGISINYDENIGSFYIYNCTGYFSDGSSSSVVAVWQNGSTNDLWWYNIADGSYPQGNHQVGLTAEVHGLKAEKTVEFYVAPFISNLEIVGPSIVEISGSAQFQCLATFSDGSTTILDAPRYDVAWDCDGSFIYDGTLSVDSYDAFYFPIAIWVDVNDWDTGLTYDRVYKSVSLVPYPTSLSIIGPLYVDEGTSTQFTYEVTGTSGYFQEEEVEWSWSSSNSEYFTLGTNGLFVSKNVSEDKSIWIHASIYENGGYASDSVEVIIRNIENPTQPEGTVSVPAGIISGTNPDAELGSYSITLPIPLYMDEAEVSWELWSEVYNWAITNGYTFTNSGDRKAPGHPVHSVNWYDCAKWCNARSEMENRARCYYVGGSEFKTGETGPVTTDYASNGFRMPTVTEWQYAARGGLQGKRFPWGDTITHDDANYKSTGVEAYDQSPTSGSHPDYDSGENPLTAPCGSFAANGYGLYDMAGNIWQWCNDETESGKRANAGGGNGDAQWLRCGTSGAAPTETTYHSLGFRTVCKP